METCLSLLFTFLFQMKLVLYKFKKFISPKYQFKEEYSFLGNPVSFCRVSTYSLNFYYFYFQYNIICHFPISAMANNWLEILLRVPIIFILDYSFSFLYEHLKSIMPWYFALFVQVSCKFYLFVPYILYFNFF